VASFLEKMVELSGQNVHLCMQCGQCSAGCPMFGSQVAMDAAPRKIMHLAQLGLAERLAVLRAPFVCSSCHVCAVRCPRGVDLARVMEALRQLSLRRNVNYVEPSQLPATTIQELPQIALISAFRKLAS
jgi:heterodisulfide reductase subunit C